MPRSREMGWNSETSQLRGSFTDLVRIFHPEGTKLLTLTAFVVILYVAVSLSSLRRWKRYLTDHRYFSLQFQLPGAAELRVEGEDPEVDESAFLYVLTSVNGVSLKKVIPPTS